MVGYFGMRQVKIFHVSDSHVVNMVLLLIIVDYIMTKTHDFGAQCSEYMTKMELLLYKIIKVVFKKN